MDRNGPESKGINGAGVVSVCVWCMSLSCITSRLSLDINPFKAVELFPYSFLICWKEISYWNHIRQLIRNICGSLCPNSNLCIVFFFFFRHLSSGSCSNQPGGVRLLASLQSYLAMTDKTHQQAMDRLGQRTYFHSDFKGGNHDNVCPSMVRGIDYIRDPRLNKVCIEFLN